MNDNLYYDCCNCVHHLCLGFCPFVDSCEFEPAIDEYSVDDPYYNFVCKGDFDFNEDDIV